MGLKVDKNLMSGTSRHTTRGFMLVSLSCMILLSLTFGQNAFAQSKSATPKKSSFKTGSIDVAAEQDFLNRTNALRASLGLGSLKTNGELQAKARNWSQTQASAGTIFHSTLTDGVTQNWHRLGENVGMGPDVPSIHDALVRSPRHYENLVDSGFTEVGIGVIRQGDVIYVSQVFMELMPEQITNPAPTNSATTEATRPSANASSSSSSSSTPVQPVAEAAPLKTASADLSAVIKKLSALEA